MRFDPPPSSPTPELGWLLAAAFGPALPPAAGSPRELARLARRFDLGPRIVSRWGTAELAERLGPASRELLAAHRRAVALGLAGERQARQIARRAVDAGIDLLFLKGMALQLVAPSPPGWRPFIDLDLLLTRQGAEELGELLRADGWRTTPEAGNPQHLPPLVGEGSLPVDLHYRLRGVRVGAARWATLEELLTAELCRPAARLGGGWVPLPKLLAAHLATHAIEQHGHRPATYPLLRAVADLADLATAEGGDELLAAVQPLVAESLAEDELEALFDLARVLGEGRLPAGGEHRAELLLRHIIAGALDPEYRKGLAIDHTAGRLRQAREDGQLMRYIARKLTGPDHPPGDGSEEPARRPGAAGGLSRPFRLAARFATAAAARLRRKLDR